MSVNRIWFPIAPSGTIDASQRQSIGVGYSGILTPPVIIPATLTRLDISGALINFFQNPDYYKAVDFNDSIQDGIDEITAFTGCNYGTALLSYTADLSYYDFLTLIPDYIGVIAIFNGTTRKWMIPTSLIKLDQLHPEWETLTGTPEYFCPINHRYIVISRKPTVSGYGNMYVLYRAAAPTLADITQIPVPLEYAELVKAYCIVDLWEQNQEFSKAANYSKTYQTQLDKLHNLVHSRRQMDRLPSLR